MAQHAGNNYWDGSEPCPASWFRRPIWVGESVDRVAPECRQAPHPRLDAVSIVGGPEGRHMTLSLASGEWSPKRLRDHCLRNIELDFSSCVGVANLRRGDGLDGFQIRAAKLVFRLRFSGDTPAAHRRSHRGGGALCPCAADFDPQSSVGR
jgi:hypothetical protein